MANDAVMGEDRAMLEYVSAAQAVQSLLKQILSQVGGYALLLMTSKNSHLQPVEAIISAQKAVEQAMDDVRALRVPADAAHHYHHLKKAAQATCWTFAAADACRRAGADEVERDALARALRTATGHLRTTAGLLPGFELVDFGQACCAMHAQMANSERSA